MPPTPNDPRFNMLVAKSPITWFAAVLLLLGSLVAAVTFLKLDYSQLAFAKPGPDDKRAINVPPVGDGPPSVLVLAHQEQVRLQEFSTYLACYEAKVAVDVGSERKVLAKCVPK